MKIEIRANEAIVEGYVNAVARDSRPIPSPRGKFLEQIIPGTFRRALERDPNVELRLNHDRLLGSTENDNLELYEDNIGLYARATITDEEIIQKAREHRLRGWSFGFQNPAVRWEETASGMSRRYIEDLDLREVSILDDRKTPAYIGTSIELRDEAEVLTEHRYQEEKPEVLEEIHEDTSEPSKLTPGGISLEGLKHKVRYYEMKGMK